MRGVGLTLVAVAVMTILAYVATLYGGVISGLCVVAGCLFFGLGFPAIVILTTPGVEDDSTTE